MNHYQLGASTQDRVARGRRWRERLPRQLHALWTPRRDRTDPIQTLIQTNAGRVAKLLPERYRRMRASPFAFFRGAAAVMAADLSSLPRTGLTIQLCGDAHIHNLGAYAAPDGRLIFDINDFDETFPGPWEWDVKRLATSLVLAGAESGQSAARCEKATHAFVAAYRQHLRVFAQMPVLALARHIITRHDSERLVAEILRVAKHVTPMRNLRRLVVPTRQGFRFHDRRPTLEHVSDSVAAQVVGSLKAYRQTLPVSHRRTFEAYRSADVAFKVVGTGSVGTRDYVLLMFGAGPHDPLFLQVKQELPSCYEPYVTRTARVAHQGQRVAEGQQLVQAASDPLLGYTRFGGHDFLVRQLADHKADLDPAALTGPTLVAYARLCGEVLAKGHARTGDAVAIASYVGASPKLDGAITDFAIAYGEQTKADYRRFLAWVRRRPRAGKRQPNG